MGESVDTDATMNVGAGEPGSVGKGVGRSTPGVGTGVWLVPAWTAEMRTSVVMDFIVVNVG